MAFFLLRSFLAQEIEAHTAQHQGQARPLDDVSEATTEDDGTESHENLPKGHRSL